MHQATMIAAPNTPATTPSPYRPGRGRKGPSACLLAAALLTTTAAINAEEESAEEDAPVVAGSTAVGADAAGSEASDKLFAIYDVPDPDGPGGWNGNAQLGFSASTGNSETSYVNAATLVSYTSYPWRHYLAADVNIGETDGTSDTERWAAAYKPEYFFSERTFAFLFLGYDHDKFADLDARYSGTLGIGHVLWRNDRHILVGELGAGYRKTEYLGTTPDSDEAIGRAALRYTGRITKNTSFSQNLTTLAGSENTFVESISALQVAMTDTLALSLNYTVRYNSFTPPGIDDTDTATSINLVAAF